MGKDKIKIDKMKNEKLDAIYKVVIMISVVTTIMIGSLLAYRAIQNGRYTTVSLGNGLELIWDNWKDEFISDEVGHMYYGLFN